MGSSVQGLAWQWSVSLANGLLGRDRCLAGVHWGRLRRQPLRRSAGELANPLNPGLASINDCLGKRMWTCR